MAARALFEAGDLGQLHDIDITVSTHMPWQLWSFLTHAPRLEILYHSIHYVDLVRAWLGDPLSVYARTVRNPRTPALAATKSTLLLDYGEWMRVTISTNHAQDFNAAQQQSFVQWEGTSNAMRYQMGVNLDYPKGRPDTLTLFRGTAQDGLDQPMPVSGNWFPDAFLGSMLSLQSFALGESDALATSVDGGIPFTMDHPCHAQAAHASRIVRLVVAVGHDQHRFACAKSLCRSAHASLVDEERCAGEKF